MSEAVDRSAFVNWLRERVIASIIGAMALSATLVLSLSTYVYLSNKSAIDDEIQALKKKQYVLEDKISDMRVSLSDVKGLAQKNNDLLEKIWQKVENQNQRGN